MRTKTKSDSPRLRLLIVDDDQRISSQLCEMFQLLGYQVSAPVGSGDELMEAVKLEAKLLRPHVAIVDLRLRLDWINEPEGFDLIQHLEPARIIIYSAFADGAITRRAFKEFEVEDTINKSSHPDELIAAVEKASQKLCAFQRGFQFGDRPKSCQPAQLVKKLQLSNLEGEGLEHLADDLIASLFPGEKSLTLDSVESSAVTSNLAARSQTVVLMAKRMGKLEYEVIKLTQAAKIRTEVENYKHYVENNLGGHFYALLEGSTSFYELGGAVYRLLGMKGGDQKIRPMRTLADAYVSDKNANLAKPLEHFFTEVWHGLYQAKTDSIVNLAKEYDKSLKLQERTTELRKKYPENELTIPGVRVKLINPFQFLDRQLGLEGGEIPTWLAVTHGDLHAGNLVVDPKYEHAWTIDFERTKDGPLYRDFAELEVDIFTRLLKIPALWSGDFFEMAVALCASMDENVLLRRPKNLPGDALRGFRLIFCLRSLAKKVTGSFAARDYLWGLLSHAVFVAHKSRAGSNRSNRALALACVAAQILAGQGPTQPKEWNISGFEPMKEEDSIII